MLKLIAKMPWLIAVFMFVLVIAVWVTFYVLAQKVPMQEVDREGVVLTVDVVPTDE